VRSLRGHGNCPEEYHYAYSVQPLTGNNDLRPLTMAYVGIGAEGESTVKTIVLSDTEAMAKTKCSESESSRRSGGSKQALAARTRGRALH
jgi:hypothetical protein